MGSNVMVKKNIITRVQSLLYIFVLSLIFHVQLYSQAIPETNHVVSLEVAKKYIQNFKNSPTVVTIKAGYFSRNIFDLILAQPKCVGIRYYYAKLDNGTPTIVIIGVDSDGKEISAGVIGEETRPCPPFCDTQSVLDK